MSNLKEIESNKKKNNNSSSLTRTTESLTSSKLPSKKIININSFLEELKCSICLDFYHLPRTLSCQHSFCSNCLEPLVKGKLFSCPQCRHSCIYESIEKVPKNTLLTNLVQNIKSSSKAACPDCKELKELDICEHCSQIFCEECLNKHMKWTLEKLDNRLLTIETLPQILESLKHNIKKSEEETTLKLITQMDKIQKQILNLWQTRKLMIIDEINRFYTKKTEEIEIAEFRLKVLEKKIKELNKRKNELDGKLVNEAHFLNKLTQLEIDLVDLEAKFQEAFSNFDINNNELKLQFNEINNSELFKSILENVKLISFSSKDDELLKAALNPEQTRKQIPVKDYFGNTVVIELSSTNHRIENLKERIKFLVGVEPKLINIVDKKKNEKLDDKLEIVIHKGKIYAKKSESKEDDNSIFQSDDEIELFVSYKH